jgi:hypothetical protein
MNTKQPNFEAIKSILYEQFIKDPNYRFSLLGKPFIDGYTKVKNAKSELNKILDNMDIRNVTNFDKSILEKYPNWFKEKRYYIDYNSHGFLDFIIINKECEY